MENHKISNEMKSLITRVQNGRFLCSSEKKNLLKTLGLAEKYLDQGNQKELTITANTETQQSENKFCQEIHKQKGKEVEENEAKEQQTKQTKEPKEFQKEDRKKIIVEHFFEKLSNCYEESNLKLIQKNYLIDQESVSQQKRRKKQQQDRQWRKFKKNDFENQQNKRRKSLRIEQIKDKQKIQTEIQELRNFYKSAQYRYNELFVLLRLSYLGANFEKISEYKVKTATIPEHKLQKLVFQRQTFVKIIQNKKQILLRRILLNK